ncbi:GDNF family receptor alpha-4-like [Solea senegalensis]|uniref:GDNF family receptor alpha-4-like n=2 Tax=Solea senegalensis TaxID=28829 RepID=A0AAV6SN39_SOLSE|nr:GDNF family receptor alpha-4-like [Solea senegalensis]KAG7518467.1 GDNF family receptor alpha-4-like [Solea senegalensis]
MIVFGTLLLLLSSDAWSISSPVFPLASAPTDCVEAHRVCSADLQCEALYRGLELCAADAAVSPLGEQAAAECLERQDVLLAKHPALVACKCQRGFRKEEQCLRIYWRVRLLPGEDELEMSPYDDTLMDTRMASLVAASSFLDGENQCLKAAQDCGLYEKCGSLRSEYVLACTKRIPGSSRCNQHKCHRALRRFLERVPEEYSLGVLFCPCTNTLCGERRRKTIVPSCSYQDMEGQQPNCLHQQSFCRRDDLCRSRLADFLSNCQPSPLTASGCLKDSAGLCLRAYAGLIGTIMTPNYISNSSADVSLWCNCEGSGNQWQDCLRLQRMFTHNSCLRNSISWMGSPGSLPADFTPPPAPRPSALVQQDVLLSNNHLPEHNNVVVESEEEEQMTQIEEESDEGGQFDVIPLYSERATVSNLGSSGEAASLNTGPAKPMLLLLLVLSASASWG